MPPVGTGDLRHAHVVRSYSVRRWAYALPAARRSPRREVSASVCPAPQRSGQGVSQHRTEVYAWERVSGASSPVSYLDPTSGTHPNRRAVAVSTVHTCTDRGTRFCTREKSSSA
eukprot:1523763-Prymnesium_polylepis.1